MFEQRKINNPDGQKTTISLEPVYWELIEMFAKGNTSQWVENELKSKPDGINKASWIRQRILIESMKPSIKKSLKSQLVA